MVHMSPPDKVIFWLWSSPSAYISGYQSKLPLLLTDHSTSCVITSTDSVKIELPSFFTAASAPAVDAAQT
jgi:hypothetical protein